jgi:hypothetical protein
MILAGVLSAIWLVQESIFGSFPYLFPLFAGPIFWFCLNKRRSLVLFLMGIITTVYFGEVVVMHFLDGASYKFRFSAEHIFFTVALFILLYLVGSIMEKKSRRTDWIDYGAVLRIWCIRFGIITMFVFSFSEVWKGLIREVYKEPGFIIACTCALPVLAGILLIFTSSRKEEINPAALADNVRENSAAVLFTLFYCLCNFLVLVPWFLHEYVDPQTGILKMAGLVSDINQILVNLALLITGIWMIIKAYKTSSSLSFYTGVGVLLITAVLRYIDLIGDYIGGAIVFFVAGTLMFGAAKMWKGSLQKKGEI